MQISLPEILRVAKDSIQFNEAQFTIEDDGTRKTVSVIRQDQESGTAPAAPKPLQIVTERPQYIPASASPPAVGKQRFYVTWGTVNNVVANNWSSHFDLSLTPAGFRFFFAKVTFGSSDSLKVASWEILTGSTDDTHETPNWQAGGDRPDYYVFSLGAVHVANGVAHITPTPGSVMITEHIVHIGGTGNAGEFTLTKMLSHYKV